MDSYYPFLAPSNIDPINSAQAAWASPEAIFPIDMTAPRTMTGQSFNYGDVGASAEEVAALLSGYEPNWSPYWDAPPAQPGSELCRLSLSQQPWTSTDYHTSDPPLPALNFESASLTPPQLHRLIALPAPPIGFENSPSTTTSSPHSYSPHEGRTDWGIPLAQQFSASSSAPASQSPQTPVKRYTCQICGRAFQRQTTLTQHQITHTGERPYGCPIAGCDKAFTTASNAKRHAKTHYRAHHHHHHTSHAPRPSY